MRSMNKMILMILMLLCVNIPMVHAQDALNGYLMEAARNNPGIKASFNEYEAALEKVPQIGALPDPQVSFGYFIQPVETRVGPQRAKISASQMFPWFGTLGARKDAATEMAKVKYEAFEDARSRLFYNVKSSYYNLYFTQKAVGITKDNITILQIFRKLALSKVEAGMASTVDVLRVDIEISDLENQLALLNDQYNVQLAEFNNQLNVDKMRQVQMPDSLDNPVMNFSMGTVLDSIRNGNHQVIQLAYAESAYEKQEQAARKSGAPNLMLGAEYMFMGKSSNPALSESESGKDAFVFPMVGISIPIYRKKYNSMVKEAQLMQESTRNAQAERVNTLESTFEKANKDLQDAGRRIPLFRLQSQRAQQALNILQTGYETSGANFEEVLRMERQLLKYRLELEKARTDKNAATAYIAYIMGK